MSNKRSFLDFSLKLSAYSKTIEKDAVKSTTLVIQRLFSTVVFGTPVDKGVARANWNLSLDSIDDSFDSTLTEAQKAIVDGEKKLNQFELGDSVFLTNATKYIRRLEDGYSKQAPQGWVKTSVEQARKDLL